MRLSGGIMKFTNVINVPNLENQLESELRTRDNTLLSA